MELSLSAGAYPQIHPEALTLATHATPEDAVSIHTDVLSRSTLAIHYATFAGSEDEVGLLTTRNEAMLTVSIGHLPYRSTRGSMQECGHQSEHE